MREYEDQYWGAFDQVPVFRHKVAIDMIEGGRILDIGCGDGLILKMLVDKKVLAEGIDHSQRAIDKAKGKGLNVQKYDFANSPLPYSDDEFDCVLMLDVLEHLYSPEMLLSEARRVTKEYIIISVPNFSSLPARIQALFGQVPENNTSKKGHIFWFSYSVLLKMIEGSHLKILRMETNSVWEDKKLIGLITKFLSKIWPGLFALSFVICCDKKSG